MQAEATLGYLEHLLEIHDAQCLFDSARGIRQVNSFSCGIRQVFQEQEHSAGRAVDVIGSH